MVNGSFVTAEYIKAIEKPQKLANLSDLKSHFPNLKPSKTQGDEKSCDALSIQDSDFPYINIENENNIEMSLLSQRLTEGLS